MPQYFSFDAYYSYSDVTRYTFILNVFFIYICAKIVLKTQGICSYGQPSLVSSYESKPYYQTNDTTPQCSPLDAFFQTGDFFSLCGQINTHLHIYIPL